MSEAREPIRIGISSCLLGHAVRYDGGHKRDAFLTDTFGRFVEWVPVCPELELGLGVPRRSLHLERDGERLRLVEKETGRDLGPAIASPQRPSPTTSSVTEPSSGKNRSNQRA